MNTIKREKKMKNEEDMWMRTNRPDALLKIIPNFNTSPLCAFKCMLPNTESFSLRLLKHIDNFYCISFSKCIKVEQVARAMFVFHCLFPLCIDLIYHIHAMVFIGHFSFHLAFICLMKWAPKSRMKNSKSKKRQEKERGRMTCISMKERFSTSAT